MMRISRKILKTLYVSFMVLLSVHMHVSDIFDFIVISGNSREEEY